MGTAVLGAFTPSAFQSEANALAVQPNPKLLPVGPVFPQPLSLFGVVGSCQLLWPK